MRTYAIHFTDGRRCEANGCKIETFFLWPANGGHRLVRACCPVHLAQAERERKDERR